MLGENNEINLEKIFENKNKPDFYTQYKTYKDALKDVMID